ncbi:MAG: prepilin-type N-terminal cleavage/methylation domain-containing protein, partial [Oligoflexia bacterium]|nr:prepilin-type N-terminal cleavage/methylation domain-containing protein [Oligoflexia bacterium]
MKKQKQGFSLVEVMIAAGILSGISYAVVFYDVTTLYFESKNEDSLKKFGYSKDCKFGDVQVVAGALI